jgi:uncharacterized protein YdhG (YjbR/CyaY superfamily)
MAGKPKSIDEYLERVGGEKRAALEKLRKAIRAAAPGAVECIAWQLPCFRLDGKLLVAFGAAKAHCSLYPMSAATVEAFRKDLRKYSTSKGTIRFPPDAPLPATLVRRIVKARIAENAAGKPKKKGRETP